MPHFCHIPTSCQDFTEEASVVRWMDLVLYGHQWKATRSHLGHFGTSRYFPGTLTDLIGFRNSLAYFTHLTCLQLCSSLVQVLLQMTGGGWRAHCHISRRGGEVESFRIEAPKRGCQNPGARLRPGDQVPRCKGSEYLTTLQNLIEFDSCMTCAC